MDIFVKPDDEIKIEFIIVKSTKGELLCHRDREDLLFDRKKDDIDMDTLEDHYVIFRKPSFADVVSINRGSIKTSEKGVEVNPLDIRFSNMNILLKSWSFKDSEGNPIPTNEENLKQLDHNVANVVGTLLEVEIGVVF